MNSFLPPPPFRTRVVITPSRLSVPINDISFRTEYKASVHTWNISANLVLRKSIKSCHDTYIDIGLSNGNRRLPPGSKAAGLKLNTEIELYTSTPPYVIIILWIINFTIFTLYRWNKRITYYLHDSRTELHKIRSRDSVVGVATGYGLDNRVARVRVPAGSRIFNSPYCPDRLLGPSSLLSNGYRRALSPGVKRQGHAANHSPPTSAEAKIMSIYISTPPCAFMAWCLIS
jgi:hypothetical protein